MLVTILYDKTWLMPRGITVEEDEHINELFQRSVLSAIMEFVLNGVSCVCFLEETLFSYVSEGLKKGCKD